LIDLPRGVIKENQNRRAAPYTQPSPAVNLSVAASRFFRKHGKHASKSEIKP
jgi:hypothetical protein